MATQTLQPVTHIFKEVNKGKYRSVKHYELVEVKNGITLLPELINVSQNRNFALSMPQYWLKIRQGKKWSNCITGLFKTEVENIYKGDVNKKQHLLIFEFSNDSDTLTIHYYKNFFVKDVSALLKQFTEVQA